MSTTTAIDYEEKQREGTHTHATDMRQWTLRQSPRSCHCCFHATNARTNNQSGMLLYCRPSWCDPFTHVPTRPPTNRKAYFSDQIRPRQRATLDNYPVSPPPFPIPLTLPAPARRCVTPEKPSLIATKLVVGVWELVNRGRAFC